MNPLFAEVILPLAVRSNFHYRIKEHQADQLAVGMRVLVNFGKSKIYTGVLRRLVENVETAHKDKLKNLEEILDQAPILYENQLKLFEWMAFYYMCTEGEVIKAALPIGLKPESALRIRMVEGLPWESLQLDEKEYLLMEALSIQPVLQFKEVADIWQILNPNPRLKTMEGRGLIELYQEVEENYKARYKSYLKLHPRLEEESAMKSALDQLNRAPQQQNLLMRVMEAHFRNSLIDKKEVQKELNIGGQIAKSLIQKQFVQEEKVQVDRLQFYSYKHHDQDIVLTEKQKKALEEIRGFFQEENRKPVLLHGVTGSGKTHLYIDLIREKIAEGKQVLYLLPEITLTKQIIDRIKSAFGERVGIYHSRFNDHERVEIWHKVRNQEYDVVVGVRSAIFLPFKELGMIVVDEEHDHSFKQTEPSPRYNARDVAIYYAQMLDIPIVLGSATPSFESYQNCLKGKYALVELPERAVAAQLPTVKLIDMRIQRKRGQVKGIFSKQLEQAIEETLARKEQVILFQNRRGYSPYLICQHCGHVPECINCDISLTYHKLKQHLRCHYCGHTDFNLQKCPHCANYTLKQAGIGTERIEEQVMERFPDYVVQRMDLDTTRSKKGYQHIINRFENKQIDILVGTQMVSKGLDFENVTLVGVIHADNLISFPDFRAYENAYQLLTQVSGRAGRSQKKGQVLIQTMMPDNVVLQQIQKPFTEFFNLEIQNREPLGYPPFTRLVRIEFRHKDRGFIEQESLRLHALLAPLFGNNLLGPDYALVARVRNQYRMQFLIKLNRQVSAHKLRKALYERMEQYYEHAPQKTLRIIVDVDPA